MHKFLDPVGEESFHSESSVLMTEIVLPSHTNALGTIFGGVVMGWMDIAGAIASARYARSPVVTVSVDHLHFIVPIKIGYTVRIHARVSSVGKTSMEVECIAESENVITGEVQRATQAYLTFVSLDDKGRPKAVPPFTFTGPDAEAKSLAAQKRRKARLI